MAFNWQTEYHRYQRYFVRLGQLYQQKKTRTYTGIILSILTVTFFLFFAIRPTLTTITGLMREIKDQRLVAEGLQDKINALRSAQEEYRLVEKDLYLVNQALPEDPQISTLLKQIETLAHQSGVTMEMAKYNQVYLREKEASPEEKEVNFGFTASGSYQNLKNFLTSLNSLRRIILVESFAFKTGKAESQSLNLSLDAKAYYLQTTKNQ